MCRTHQSCNMIQWLIKYSLRKINYKVQDSENYSIYIASEIAPIEILCYIKSNLLIGVKWTNKFFCKDRDLTIEFLR